MENFTQGQVVQCRVKNVNPSKRLLILSFNLTDSRQSKPKPPPKSSTSIPLGAFVEGVVKRVTGDIIVLDIEEYDAVALLPKMHLSDHDSLSENLFSLVTEGLRLSGLLVYHHSNKQTVYISKNYQLFLLDPYCESYLVRDQQTIDYPS